VQAITEGALAACPKCSSEGIERLFTPTANIVVKTAKSRGSDEPNPDGGMGDLGGVGDDFGGDDFGSDDDLGGGDDDLGGMGDMGGEDSADGDLGGDPDRDESN
jgi:hypothetical protein